MRVAHESKHEPEERAAAVEFPAEALAWKFGVRDLPSIAQLSPTLLAYIGDAVYELHVRTQLLMPPKRINDYHRAVVARVRAESQAELLQQLQEHLTPAEQEIVRRGRNASSRAPRKLSPAIYQQATGLEALIGYLFLTDSPRLAVLLTRLSPDPPIDGRCDER